MPQSFDVAGPMAALDLPSEQGVQSFYYPANLTTVSNHYVRFDCAIFEDSKYQQGIAGKSGGNVDAGLGLAKAVGALAALAGPVGAVGAAAIAAATGINITAPLGQIFQGSSSSNPLAAAQNITGKNNSFGAQAFYQVFQGLRGIGNKKVINRLYLYTPDTMSFGYANRWDSINLREEFGVLADGISAASDIAGGSAAGSSAGGAGAVMGSRGALGVGAGLIGQLASVKSGLDTVNALRGFPVNPMTETIYRDTTPRTFQFEFIMYPQTEKESAEIFNITQQFAFHAAGELATSEIGGFLIMPSVFDIKFMFLARDASGQAREMENPWIRKISTCALRDVTIDMSPNGQWQAQEDGSPSAVRLTLSFVELDIMTKDRIKKGF